MVLSLIACRGRKSNNTIGWVAVIVGVVYPGSGGGQRVSGDAIRGDISSLFL